MSEWNDQTLAEMIAKSELQWPKKGDVLFNPTNMPHDPVIGERWLGWLAYAEGYRLAADRLVETIVADRVGRHKVVYPVLFLYRHALEVILKYLIIIGRDLLEQEGKVPAHHSLLDLWKICRPILEEVWPDGSKVELEAVGDTLKQFAARDPGSYAFRYPVDKKGTPSLTQMESVDIENLSLVANRAYRLIESSIDVISEYLKNRPDEADFYDPSDCY